MFSANDLIKVVRLMHGNPAENFSDAMLGEETVRIMQGRCGEEPQLLGHL
jgi:hypothetical protein